MYMSPYNRMTRDIFPKLRRRHGVAASAYSPLRIHRKIGGHTALFVCTTNPSWRTLEPPPTPASSWIATVDDLDEGDDSPGSDPRDAFQGLPWVIQWRERKT